MYNQKSNLSPLSLTDPLNKSRDQIQGPEFHQSYFYSKILDVIRIIKTLICILLVSFLSVHILILKTQHFKQILIEFMGWMHESLGFV